MPLRVYLILMRDGQNLVVVVQIAREHGADRLFVVDGRLGRRRGGGRGVAGARRALDVLSSGEGQQLLLTLKYLAEHPGEAEAAVEFALDHDADVELVSGEAAALLDLKAGGIGALLRYVRAGARGQEAVLALLGPGDFLGEGCIIGNPVRMATTPGRARICWEVHPLHAGAQYQD